MKEGKILLEFNKKYWALYCKGENHVRREHIFETKKKANEYKKFSYAYAHLWKVKKIKLTEL